MGKSVVRWFKSKPIVVLGAAALAGGCAMLSSDLISEHNEVPQVVELASHSSNGELHYRSPASTRASPAETIRCRSKLGAYYLSKRLVHVNLLTETEDVTQGAGNDKKVVDRRVRKYTLTVGAPETVAERSRAYCLDFLESATSQDHIEVTRSEEGVLESISTVAEDQSAKIIKTLVQALFVAITLNPDFDASLTRGGERSGEEAITVEPDRIDVRYDPMDPVHTALLNQRLSPRGFCLLLEGQMPASAEDVDCYCDNPMGYLSRRERTRKISMTGWRTELEREEGLEYWSNRNDERQQRKAVPHDAAGTGIFYRPRRPYSYYLMVKPNLKVKASCNRPASGPRASKRVWSLREQQTLHLENEAPVLALGVDRTFFATRSTLVKFDDGVLYDVRVKKTSELAGFVEVPLFIAQGVAAVPANIIKVRIDQTKNQERLVAAQIALMEQQKAYLVKLQELENTVKNPPTKTVAP